MWQHIVLFAGFLTLCHCRRPIQALYDPDCAYGDKASWCKDIEPYRCYYDEDTCCATCSIYEKGDLPEALKENCKYGDKVELEICMKDLENPADCYENGNECCGTCANLCTNITGCEYGDKAGWCDTITSKDCYEHSTAEMCCKTCAHFRRGPSACKYGDRIAGCTTSDCVDKTRAASCCETCMKNVPAMIALNSMMQCLKEDEFWCENIEDRDCYDHYYACCNTCRKRKRYPGCEYGDEYEWCAVDDCKDSRLRGRCCHTCGVNALTSCRNDASWCTSLAGSFCYDGTTRSTCCLRCSDLKRGPPGCEYGDKGTWCGNTKAYQCYDPSYRGTCCRICQELKTGPQGCEYGDLTGNCMELDCKDPAIQSKCCRTCSAYIQPQPYKEADGKSATLTPGAKATIIIGPTGPKGDRVSIDVSSNGERRGQASAYEIGSTTCEDAANWCYTIRANDCYYESTRQSCCKTCSMYYVQYSGALGCEYGDRYSWCSYRYCNTDKNRKACCTSCRSVQLPEPQPIQQCLDQAEWCQRSMSAVFCYNEEIRRETCCYSCSRMFTGVMGCEYGDKKTWCDSLYPNECSLSDVRENCCDKCKTFVP